MRRPKRKISTFPNVSPRVATSVGGVRPWDLNESGNYSRAAGRPRSVARRCPLRGELCVEPCFDFGRDVAAERAVDREDVGGAAHLEVLFGARTQQNLLQKSSALLKAGLK
jgi:hypothetical protein